MSRLKQYSAGFTLPEMLITIGLVGIVTTMAAPIFVQAFRNYFSLNYEDEQFTSITGQSQRLAQVIRGLTDINSADGNNLDIYAYFYPDDTYVSDVKYYLSSDQKTLYADVTPMTADPPLGTPITSEKKTYKIMDNFQKSSSVNLFDYLDQDNNKISLPLSDLSAVKSITINLAVPDQQGPNPGQQTSSLTVNLRNRKTNL